MTNYVISLSAAAGPIQSVATVEFYDKDGTLMHEITVKQGARRISESERFKDLKVRYFAINLENTPLLMLDDVKVIKIID